MCLFKITRFVFVQNNLFQLAQSLLIQLLIIFCVVLASKSALSRLRELLYQGSWPWEHDPLGTPSDVAALTVDAVRAFHRSRYAPNRAVLTVVGDVDDVLAGIARPSWAFAYVALVPMLWAVRRMTPDGASTMISVPAAVDWLNDVTVGPDGTWWIVGEAGTVLPGGGGGATGVFGKVFICMSLQYEAMMVSDALPTGRAPVRERKQW